MTGIKPPGSDSAPSPADRLEGSEPADEPTPSQALDPAAESGEVAQADAVEATDAVSRLAAELRAGDIDVDTAMERLVERAMHEVAPALSAVEREELESMLREALEADPTLAELRGDLEQV